MAFDRVRRLPRISRFAWLGGSLRPFIAMAFVGECVAVTAAVDPRIAITSIVERDRVVYAVTGEGVYRTTRGAKIWEPVPVPAHVPAGGQLIPGPAGPEDFYYYGRLSDGNGAPVAAASGRVSGIYHHSPGSTAWASVLTSDQVVSAVAAGTNLVVLEMPPDWRQQGFRLRQTSDDGRTWRSLINPTLTDVYLSAVIADPERPGLVSLISTGLRLELWSATDESYQWKRERHVRLYPPRPDPRTNAPFFVDDRLAPHVSVPMVGLSLANYWTLGGLDRALNLYPCFACADPSCYALQLSTAGGRHFRVGDPVELPVTFSLLAEAGTAPIPSLADTDRPEVFWGIRRITPSGHREIFPSKPGPGLKGALRHQPGWRAHRFAPDKPYRRSIRLTEIAPFTEPGRYQLQLVYSSEGLADEKRKEWLLLWSSPVFEIELGPGI